MNSNITTQVSLLKSDIKIHRPCCGDPAEELEGLCGHFPPQRRDSSPEQELPAHPGRALGPSHPQDPHQYSAGRCSAGLVCLHVATELYTQSESCDDWSKLWFPSSLRTTEWWCASILGKARRSILTATACGCWVGLESWRRRSRPSS